MIKVSWLLATITLLLPQHEIVDLSLTSRPRLRSVRVSNGSAWVAGRQGIFHSTDSGHQWRRIPVEMVGRRPTHSVNADWRTGMIAWADSQNAIICGPDEMISVG